MFGYHATHDGKTLPLYLKAEGWVEGKRRQAFHKGNVLSKRAKPGKL